MKFTNLKFKCNDCDAVHRVKHIYRVKSLEYLVTVLDWRVINVYRTLISGVVPNKIKFTLNCL